MLLFQYNGELDYVDRTHVVFYVIRKEVFLLSFRKSLQVRRGNYWTLNLYYHILIDNNYMQLFWSGEEVNSPRHNHLSECRNLTDFPVLRDENTKFTLKMSELDPEKTNMSSTFLNHLKSRQSEDPFDTFRLVTVS